MGNQITSTLATRALITIAVWLLSSVGADAQESVFTNLQDVLVDRAFKSETSIANGNNLVIGLESGYIVIPGQFRTLNKAFLAGTYSGYARTTADTLSVTVTAPAGKHIASISYQQAGARVLSRGYFSADGSGTLTVNNVPQSFNFQHPNLTKTVNLAGQNLETVSVSIAIELKAYRNSSFPRVTAPPGGAHIEIQSATLSVVFE